MKKIINLTLVLFVMFVLSTSIAMAENDTATATGTGTGNAEITQTYEAADRPFPVPGNITLPTIPGFFGDNNKPGPQFIPLDKLLMYNTKWRIVDDYKFAPGVKYKKTLHADKVPADEVPETMICTKNVFDKTKFTIKHLVTGFAVATKSGTISSDLLAKIIYEASLFGATHVQFLAEGTRTELETTGWGIGFNHTEAQSGSMSTGGTGFSTGWAGYHNLPWQQFFFLKVTEANAVANVEPTVDETVSTDADLVDENVEKAVKKTVTE